MGFSLQKDNDESIVATIDTRRGQSMTLAGDTVLLAGFDFGSTTSRAMAAYVRLSMNCVTGRMEFTQPELCYRSEACFTPFRDDQQLDIPAISALLDGWLDAITSERDSIFSGGAIITGLAARQDNVIALTEVVESRIGAAVVATARDPMLESWLAFMGGCVDLSHQHPTTGVLNLDIGGGTTNAALGMNGQVVAAGCHSIGARHFQFGRDGTTLTTLSAFGKTLCDHLDFSLAPGHAVSEQDIERITHWYVRALEDIAQGSRASFSSACGLFHEDCPFTPSLPPSTLLTFSGGVGEMIYAALNGQDLPPRGLYGDLGADLARGIMASPLLSRDLHRAVPANQGRATVYGLTMHSTDISGATVFQSEKIGLPLRDLPILGTFDMQTPVSRLSDLLTIARRHPSGFCLRLTSDTPPNLATIRATGERIATALEEARLPSDLPLIILTDHNIGHTLGSYITRWGALPVNLMVLDEVPVRDARFVRIGLPHNIVFPVSFYGMS